MGSIAEAICYESFSRMGAQGERMPGTADAYQDTRTEGQLGPACPAALDLESELKGGLGRNFDLVTSGTSPESCGTTAACLPHGEWDAKRMGSPCHVCCAMFGPSWHFSYLASHAQAGQKCFLHLAPWWARQHMLFKPRLGISLGICTGYLEAFGNWKHFESCLGCWLVSHQHVRLIFKGQAEAAFQQGQSPIPFG